MESVCLYISKNSMHNLHIQRMEPALHKQRVEPASNSKCAIYVHVCIAWNQIKILNTTQLHIRFEWPPLRGVASSNMTPQYRDLRGSTKRQNTPNGGVC